SFDRIAFLRASWKSSAPTQRAYLTDDRKFANCDPKIVRPVTSLVFTCARSATSHRARQAVGRRSVGPGAGRAASDSPRLAGAMHELARLGVAVHGCGPGRADALTHVRLDARSAARPRRARSRRHDHYRRSGDRRGAVVDSRMTSR